VAVSQGGSDALPRSSWRVDKSGLSGVVDTDEFATLCEVLIHILDHYTPEICAGRWTDIVEIMRLQLDHDSAQIPREFLPVRLSRIIPGPNVTFVVKRWELSFFL
jgi:hypothetical protein